MEYIYLLSFLSLIKRAFTMYNKNNLKHFTISILLLLFIGCQNAEKQILLPPVYDNLMIVPKSDTATICWNISNKDNIAAYELFYRSHTSNGIEQNWIILRTNLKHSDKLEAKIFRSELKASASVFDFAVVAIDSQGNKSDYHISTDTTASPNCGWYLYWPN